MSTTPHAIKKFAKFLEYVLGRRPDEFGLLPDPDGFVRITTLFQGLHEDPEWRYVRQAHLNSVILMERPAPIEILGDRIRACNREQLPAIVVPDTLPKLLFTTVRRRAYPVVHEKGIRPGGARSIMLSADPETSERWGRRADNEPVLITVQVDSSKNAGTAFEKYGDTIYLADFIAAQSFSGPPLPKENAHAHTPKPSAQPVQPKTPGSYLLDPSAFSQPGATPHQRLKRDEMEWKKDRRRARKEKARQRQ
ncbi:MAG: hypothetical protein VR64_08535 [Desulfatitalea sp. BRH_c12]|nr:MAG: hypothetical protein VR64_08535 [Desulfatitalea sp. BRH_c12]